MTQGLSPERFWCIHFTIVRSKRFMLPSLENLLVTCLHPGVLCAADAAKFAKYQLVKIQSTTKLLTGTFIHSRPDITFTLSIERQHNSDPLALSSGVAERKTPSLRTRIMPTATLSCEVNQKNSLQRSYHNGLEDMTNFFRSCLTSQVPRDHTRRAHVSFASVERAVTEKPTLKNFSSKKRTPQAFFFFVSCQNSKRSCNLIFWHVTSQKQSFLLSSTTCRLQFSSTRA